MSFRFWHLLQQLFWGNDKHERAKLVFLMCSFFFIIGSYTVVRTLKDSFFTNIVGLEYLPQAKLLSIIVLIPGVLLFSRLTDLLRRSHIMYFYCMLYGFGCLAIAYLIGHPEVGLLNTNLAHDRWFGWFAYLFIEGYNPFVVSLFWAFCNTVTTPEGAKWQYPLIVAASKLGGVATSSFACVALNRVVTGTLAEQVTTLQWLLFVSSCMLLVVPYIIMRMMQRVPKSHLHGYEAAYQADKDRVRSESRVAIGAWGAIKGMFSGMVALIRYPYMFGLFGMIFFWEIINVVVNFERLTVARDAGLSLAGQTSYLLTMDCMVHVVGLVFTITGTRALLELLGERRALMFVPVATGITLVFYLWAQSITAMMVAYVVIRAINYAFAYPLRESLYIPTTRDLKFKTKSWIDSFGTKVAKGCGSYYSACLRTVALEQVAMVQVTFFGIVLAIWFMVAHLLGRRYEQAVANNEVIGT